MRVIDRLLLTLYALINIALVALISCMVWLPGLMGDVIRWAQGMQGRWEIGALASLLLLAYLAITLRLLFVRGSSARGALSVELARTDYGDARISLPALDAMVQRAGREVSGIRELKSAVFAGKDGVIVDLKVYLLMDAIAPEVAGALQKTVADFIRDHTGLSVHRVRVYVDHSAGQAQRA